MLIAFWSESADCGAGVLIAGCVSPQCSGKAFCPDFLCCEGGNLLARSVGGLRVGSTATGVWCRGEGVCALPDQLCGDGFSGDTAAQASLGSLTPVPKPTDQMQGLMSLHLIHA